MAEESKVNSVKPTYDNSKIPSLKNFSTSTPPPVSDAPSEEKSNEVVSSLPVNTADESIVPFEQAWADFLNTVRSNGKRMLISLLERTDPVYDGSQEFMVQVPHKVAAEMIEDEKQDMLIYLRKRTGNALLTLKIDILQTEVSVTPYTNKEKFESMAEKNPMLRDLKNALDLEIE